MGVLDIIHYSTWTTKIHCQQFDSSLGMIKAYDMDMGGEKLADFELAIPN